MEQFTRDGAVKRGKSVIKVVFPALDQIHRTDKLVATSDRLSVQPD